MSFVSAAFLAVAIAFGIATPASARQDDTRLDKLFDTLQTTTSESEAQIAAARIWELWFQSGRPDIDNLLARGGEAMNRGDFKEALDRFNDVIAEDPDLAEGWNRRATLYYLMGEYEASIADRPWRWSRGTLAHFRALAWLISGSSGLTPRSRPSRRP